LSNKGKQVLLNYSVIVIIMSGDNLDGGGEVELRAGQLVIVEAESSGIEEKWFTSEEFSGKTIRQGDNFSIPKHSIGCIIGFINSYHTCMALVAWSNMNGKKLLLAADHLTSLESFVERLDNE